MDVLLEFAKGIGLEPKQVASIGGGEFHCACPKCDGTDRFCLWPNEKRKNCEGSYWCRQCGVSGDTIEFGRQFLDMGWKEVTARCNFNITFSERSKF